MTPEVRPPDHGIRIPWEWHNVDSFSGTRVSLSGFSHTAQLGTIFLASPLLGIVVTGCRDPGASTHLAPGARVYAVACAHTNKAEGAHGEGGCGMPR